MENKDLIVRRFIIVTTNFSAIHHWPECPIEEVRYLREPHRHLFHVTIKAAVSHGDREIEFIDLKNTVNRYLAERYEGKFIGRTSCEDIAEDLLTHFSVESVSVLEDGENGAEVIGVRI